MECTSLRNKVLRSCKPWDPNASAFSRILGVLVLSRMVALDIFPFRDVCYTNLVQPGSDIFPPCQSSATRFAVSVGQNARSNGRRIHYVSIHHKPSRPESLSEFFGMIWFKQL
jgi:hypothetical protein